MANKPRCYSVKYGVLDRESSQDLFLKTVLGRGHTKFQLPMLTVVVQNCEDDKTRPGPLVKAHQS